MQKIRVGNDVLQFPDDMDDNAIKAVIQKEYGNPQAMPTQQQPIQQEKPLQAQPTQSMNPDMGQSAREISPKERINQQINEYDKFVYGIPVIGGIKKGFDDVAMGGSQLLARGVDALTLGNTNLSKSFDKSVQDQEQAYNDANKADTSGYINDIARFGGGVMSGGTGNIAGGALKNIAAGAGIGTATSPVLQEKGQEGNQGEFAKQKAIQLGVGGALGAGGAVLGKTIGALRRPSTAIKTSSQIKDLASQAFQLADEQGARIQPQETNSLIDRLGSLGSKSDLGKALNTSGKAEFVQETLNKFKDKNLSFKDVEELDKELTSIITDSFKEGRVSADGYKVQKIQDELRDWVDNLNFSGNDKQGLQTLKTARSLYSQSMKLRDIESILQRADSMEQPATAIKTGFRQLLNNPKRLRGYTDKEKALIKKASQSGNVLDVVRSLGSRLNVITGIASGNPVQAGLSMAGSTASRGLGVKLQTNKALDVANEIASRNIDTTKPVNVIKKNLNPINSSVVATQSSRMTGQAMNAMTNKQNTQEQQTVKNKSINDYFKEYEADTGTKNKSMSDYFKEYEDKPQAQYEFKRPDFVNDTTQAESSGNPDAKSKTSTASGLGGFIDNTWNEMKKKYGKQYGLNNKADPMQQQIAIDLLADDNEKYLKQRLKNRDISTKDLHVAHFMGAGGATRMILNIQRGQGDKLAYQTFRKEANANKPIFFDGSRPRTINEVYAVLASREK